MARAWRNKQIWRGLARLACSLGEGAGELQQASGLFPRAATQALSQGTLPTALQPAACASAALLRPQHTCYAAQPGISSVSRRLRSQAQPMQQQRSIFSAVAAAAAADAGSSSIGTETCPLHACLLRYGITDLAAFSKPHHLALSQEAVDADVEPKLAALRAEGLSPAQLQKLLPPKGNTILPCSYQDTFAPNLDLLRSIAALRKPGNRRKGQQRLTAVGQVLARNRQAAIYLSRSPAAVQRLLEWLEGGLGIGLAELAGCSQLFEALKISEAAGQAVASLLLGKGVSAARVVKAFQTMPNVFSLDPVLLEAKLGYLAATLQVDAAPTLELVLQLPGLLTYNLEGRLPQLLQYLDGYMGEEGAGRRLVLQAPVLGTCTAAIAQRGVSDLAALGYQQQHIQGFISKQPQLLTYNLDSPDQRQKIEWIISVSPWTLDDFLASPQYFFCSTSRLASRLAWMRAAGLEPQRTPGTLATTSDATFVSTMSRRLQKQCLASKGDSSEPLPVLGVADWKLWEAEWLQTEEGQRWGFLPEM